MQPVCDASRSHLVHVANSYSLIPFVHVHNSIMTLQQTLKCCCLCAGSYAEMQTSAQEYPQNLACAMLQALHVLVKNLESTHKARLECRSMITAGQQQAQSLMRSPLPFHQAQGMKLQADVHSMLSAHSKMSEGMAATMIPSIRESLLSDYQFAYPG